MWLSYLCNHLARSSVSKSTHSVQKEHFSDIYNEIVQIENRLRSILREDFQMENYFTVTIMAEAI
jgi:hypothetical protein